MAKVEVVDDGANPAPKSGMLSVSFTTRGDVEVDFGTMIQRVVFSPQQAREVAASLKQKADEVDNSPAGVLGSDKVDEAWLTLLGAVKQTEDDEGPHPEATYCFISEHGEVRLSLFRYDTTWRALLGNWEDPEWPDDIIGRAQVLNLLAALEFPIAGEYRR